MRYVLIYCSALNIFAMTDPWGGHVALPEADLDKRFGGNRELMAWKEFCKANPDRQVQYDMLPPANGEIGEVTTETCPDCGESATYRHRIGHDGGSDCSTTHRCDNGQRPEQHLAQFV